VTSLEFLKQFGLRSLADLPPLAELAAGGSERVFEQFRETFDAERPSTPETDKPH
jgi:hypothetical protein